MTRQEVNALSGQALINTVKFWQGQLSLSDWEIKTLLKSEEEMDGQAGTVEWDMSTKQAVIKLIKAETITTSLDFPYDLEKVLVHELLHLHSAPFDTFKKGSRKYEALEVMINKTADALVHSARRYRLADD